jgi:hypothetical protein
LSDGEPLAASPIDRNLELTGVTVRGDVILGVAGDRAYALDRDGAVLGETAVSGMAAAAGIAIDDDNALILDGANDRIAIVPLDSLK